MISDKKYFGNRETILLRPFTSEVTGGDKTLQSKTPQDKISRQNATQTIRHIVKMSQDKTSHRQNVTGQNVT